MDYTKLKQLKMSELVHIGKEMELQTSKVSKEELLNNIIKCFKTYERHKKVKVDKYEKIERVGGDGKEGKTFVVKHNGKKYAMKTFPKSKSSTTLKKELDFLQRASETGLSPKIHDYDTVSNYIVMDLLDKNLLEVLQSQKGKLTISQQKEILKLFDGLDKVGIFHRDPNPLNIMTRGGKFYIIDFGFAIDITDAVKKKHNIERLNYYFMTTGLLLKLKEVCAEARFPYLEKILQKKEK